MKALTSVILMLSWNMPTGVLALQTGYLNNQKTDFSQQNILVSQQRGGGGNRGGGGRPGGRPSGGGGRPGGRPSGGGNIGNRPINRPSGGANVGNRPINRPPGGANVGNRPINRPSGGNGNFNLNADRNGSNRVTRPNINNRPNNGNNRDFNFNNDRNFSNRVNRNNIGNTINNNRVVINNPRGWNSWGWHGGSPWYPSNNYWGGGFWGPFAAGAVTGLVTGAAINAAANQPRYVVVQSDTPGYTLLNNYGLTQIECSNNVVIIDGPSNSVICAVPNATVPAGTYSIDTSTLTLIPKY